MRRRRPSRRYVQMRHDAAGYPDTVLYRPLRPTHLGITRSPRERTAPDLPLTDAHREVLTQLGDELVGASAIARQLGRPASGVTSNLYALADRGLVVREPRRGWRLA